MHTHRYVLARPLSLGFCCRQLRKPYATVRVMIHRWRKDLYNNIPPIMSPSLSLPGNKIPHDSAIYIWPYIEPGPTRCRKSTWTITFAPTHKNFTLYERFSWSVIYSRQISSLAPFSCMHTSLVLSLTIFAVKFGCIVNNSSRSVTVLYTWQHFFHQHSSPISNVISPWYLWSASSPCPRHSTFQYILLQRLLLFP